MHTDEDDATDLNRSLMVTMRMDGVIQHVIIDSSCVSSIPVLCFNYERFAKE